MCHHCQTVCAKFQISKIFFFQTLALCMHTLLHRFIEQCDPQVSKLQKLLGTLQGRTLNEKFLSQNQRIFDGGTRFNTHQLHFVFDATAVLFSARECRNRLVH